jgi:hypothetical protein
MPYVHAELEHLETILHNQLTEMGIGLPVFFGFRGQVKKH